MSLQRGVPSEYTRMILVQSDKVKPGLDSVLPEELCYCTGSVLNAVNSAWKICVLPAATLQLESRFFHLVLSTSSVGMWPSLRIRGFCDMHVAYYNMVSEESFVIYVEWINSLANVDLKNNKSLSSRRCDALLVGGVNDLAFSHPNKQLCVITFGDDKPSDVSRDATEWR
ncbi:hypothetical protein Tco_1231085 [Tanacetum coccineum]